MASFFRRQGDTDRLCFGIVLQSTGCITTRSHTKIKDPNPIIRSIVLAERASCCLHLISDLLHHLVEFGRSFPRGSVGSLSLTLEVFVSFCILPSL